MTTPMRTGTLPQGSGAPPVPPPDLVTALREMGTGAWWPLSPGRPVFTLGKSEGCDVTAARDYISQVHCLLERWGARLRVVDRGSKNGIYLEDVRYPTFDVGVGDVFRVASTRMLALGEEMLLAAPELSLLLGFSAHDAVDRALRASIRARVVLIAGPTGCRWRSVAEVMHRASSHRDDGLVDINTAVELATVVRQGARAVLVDAVRAPELLRSLHDAFRVDTVVRWFVLARDEHVGRLRPPAGVAVELIEIPPLRRRRAEILRILDVLFARAHQEIDGDGIGADNGDALATYRWPRNFEELYEVVDWLPVLLRHGGITRAAAEELGENRSTLQQWAKRLRLAFPNQRRDDAGGER